MDSTRQKQKIWHWVCWAILLGSFVCRMMYADKVLYSVSPHDLNAVSDWTNIPDGHLGYIQYLYQYRHLPDFSPIDYPSQYYHPPLFHLLAAIVMGFFDPIRNGNVTEALECIQLANMAAVSLIPLLGYLMFRRMGLTTWGLLSATTMLSFAPPLFHLGAALNNDGLMLVFLTLTCYFAICWNQEPQMRTIIGMALSLALAMLCKTSAVLIAPALACLFLYRLCITPKGFQKLWKQFLVFGLVSIPLGLSWVLRQWFLFQVPFSYVLEQGTDSFQYVGDCSMAVRFGLPSGIQWTSYRIDWDHAKDYANIWGQTFLSYAVDEAALHARVMKDYTDILWMIRGNLAVLVGGFVGMLIGFFNRQRDRGVRLLWLVSTLVFFGSYILFAVQQPFICTMNFRYIGLLLIPLAWGWGEISERLSKKRIWINALLTLLLIGSGVFTCYAMLQYAI